MAWLSTAKEFHRLMKRVGRLTDDQASIDDVNWDDGALHSFQVTIMPNASYYKGGRFKFTIELPDNPNEMPGVWCDTEIYHPNIDRHETKTDRMSTNICLNVFGNGIWDRRYGLEGLVVGILFLMHNPNVSDPLSPEFDERDMDKETFAKNVKDYMAGELVDGDYHYYIDFRVIDGEFKDLTLIENNAKVEGASTAEQPDAEATTEDKTNNNKTAECQAETTNTKTELSEANLNNAALDEQDSTEKSNAGTEAVIDKADTTEGNLEQNTDKSETTNQDSTNAENIEISNQNETNAENNETTNQDITNLENNQGQNHDTTNEVNNETLNQDKTNAENSDTPNQDNTNAEVTEAVTIENDRNAADSFDSDDEYDDDNVMPVKFIVDEDDEDYFIIDFGGFCTETTDKDAGMSAENVDEKAKEFDDLTSTANTESTPDSNDNTQDSNSSTRDCDINLKHQRSESVCSTNNTHGHGLLARSVSVPSDFYVKHVTKHKTKETMGLIQMAHLALDCIFTVYRNML